MTLRSHVSALLVLSFLSWNASAQAQARPAKGPAPAVTYGSFERTKLLQKGRNPSESVLRLGAADRRSLLTTGKSVYKKKPERRYYHR